jgi:hypothetical protein
VQQGAVSMEDRISGFASRSFHTVTIRLGGMAVRGATASPTAGHFRHDLSPG